MVPMVRVWACLMMHVEDPKRTSRNQGRLATVLLSEGKIRKPLSPQMVMQKLNSLEPIGRLDKHVVRKALRDLEEAGLVRVVGTRRFDIRIFVYARPLQFRRLLRPLERELEAVPDKSEDDLPEPPNLGVKIDPQISPKRLNERQIQDVVIMPIRTVIVKTFLRTIREELAAVKNLGVDTDPQKVIDEVVKELVLGVQNAYQKVLLGVGLVPQTSDAYIKERARASVVISSKEQAPPPPQPFSTVDRPKAEEDGRSPYQIFKDQYPKERFDEAKTKPSFEKKTKAQQRHILDRLKVYLECGRWKDQEGRWIPLSSKWLESYEADPPPVIRRQTTKSATRGALEAFAAGEGE
jgi:hypothetical protein